MINAGPRPQTRRKKWLLWLNILLAIYLLGGVAVYFFQDHILFHPEKTDPKKPYNFAASFKEVNVALDGKYNMNVIQFTVPDSLSKGVVLYFHGNKKNISWYAANAPLFTKNGYEVWMPDYPGYGKSTGVLTESKLYDYALQLYIMARSKYGADSIVLYGKSLGTGIASWLASKKSCRQVILESPYYSMTSLAAHYFPVYPVGKLLKYRLPSYEYLSIVNAPVTIFHGTADKVIPYSNAAQLKTVLKASDKFITIAGGGHNDLPQSPVFIQSLDSLLNP